VPERSDVLHVYGRRDFLRYTAIIAGAGVLAACKQATTTSPGGPTDTQTGTSPSATRPPASAEPGTLEVFDWAGYGDGAYGDDVLWKAYKKLYPDQPPNFTTFKDDDSGYAKVASGTTYDIAHPCGYRWQDWFDLGVLQPWDKSLISSFPDLNQSLQAAGQFDGQQYFIAADWGFAAPMWRADKVDPVEDSWGIL
jgi:spermidine/putrescine-binding protein